MDSRATIDHTGTEPVDPPISIAHLMRTLRGGFYWDTPDYAGLFAWGATASFDSRHFQDALRTGRLRLLTRHIPDFLRKEMPCQSSCSVARRRNV